MKKISTNPIGNTFLLTDAADTLLGLDDDLRTLDMDNKECMDMVYERLQYCVHNITQFTRESQVIYDHD